MGTRWDKMLTNFQVVALCVYAFHSLLVTLRDTRMCCDHLFDEMRMENTPQSSGMFFESEVQLILTWHCPDIRAPAYTVCRTWIKPGRRDDFNELRTVLVKNRIPYEAATNVTGGDVILFWGSCYDTYAKQSKCYFARSLIFLPYTKDVLYLYSDVL